MTARNLRPFSLIALLIVAGASRGQEAASDPWPPAELLQPADLVKAMQSGKSQLIVSVAFPVLYHGRHILNAVNAGPTSKPEGIEALKNAVAKVPKDAEIVIYCGCCPMVKCPNIRPAYRTLKELGFTRVRVLSLPTNFHDDWASKNYPSEGPGASN